MLGSVLQLDQAKKKQRLKDGQAAAQPVSDEGAEQDDRPGPSALRFDVPTGTTSHPAEPADLGLCFWLRDDMDCCSYTDWHSCTKRRSRAPCR